MKGWLRNTVIQSTNTTWLLKSLKFVKRKLRSLAMKISLMKSMYHPKILKLTIVVYLITSGDFSQNSQYPLAWNYLLQCSMRLKVSEDLSIKFSTIPCSETLFDADIYILIESAASLKIFSLKDIVDKSVAVMTQRFSFKSFDLVIFFSNNILDIEYKESEGVNNRRVSDSFIKFSYNW